jgi:hypothetical protein
MMVEEVFMVVIALLSAVVVVAECSCGRNVFVTSRGFVFSFK